MKKTFGFNVHDIVEIAMLSALSIVLDQFLKEYQSDPELELITTVSNELTNILNATVSYSSSDENVVYFEEVDGKKYFETKDLGAPSEVF